MFTGFKKTLFSYGNNLAEGNADFFSYVSKLTNPVLPTWRHAANAKALLSNALDFVVSVGMSGVNAAVVSNPYWDLTLCIILMGQTLKNVTKLIQLQVDPDGAVLPNYLPAVINDTALFVGFTNIAYTPMGAYVQGDLLYKSLAFFGQPQLQRMGFDEPLAERTLSFCGHGLVTAGNHVYNALTVTPRAPEKIVQINKTKNYTSTIQAQYDTDKSVVVANQTISYHFENMQFFLAW